MLGSPVRRSALLSLGLLGLLGGLPTGCGRIGIDTLNHEVTARDAGDLSFDSAFIDGPDSGADADLEPSVLSEDASARADADADADVSAQPGVSSVSDAASGSTRSAGTRIVIDNTTETELTDFAVRVQLDTRSMIEQGALAPDCSDLRIYGGRGCAQPRAFFLPEHACDRATSELWVLLPRLGASGSETLAVAVEAGGLPSDGAQVFELFDDFDGSELDTSRWIERGAGTLSVEDGFLRSTGTKSIESVDWVASAGLSIVGARVAVIGKPDTDVEIGVGTVNDDRERYNAWAFSRDWDGATFLSYSSSLATFNGPSGSGCNNLQRRTPPPLGSAWAATSAPASFQNAEFSYTNAGGLTTTRFRTSRGAAFKYNAPSGCTLPSSLPVFLSLDHQNNTWSPTQRVDYVYVRPAAESDPTATVLLDSSEACGSNL